MLIRNMITVSIIVFAGPYSFAQSMTADRGTDAAGMTHPEDGGSDIYHEKVLRERALQEKMLHSPAAGNLGFIGGRNAIYRRDADSITKTDDSDQDRLKALAQSKVGLIWRLEI